MTRVGTNTHRYDVVRDWAVLPNREPLGIVSGVAVDSNDNVYVYGRGPQPVMVFDSKGTFLDSWGHDLILDAHGVHIDASDAIFLVDRDAHQVLKCRSDGTVTLRIGTRGEPSFEAPFNHPTSAAVAPDGDIYVSDGYANSRIHRFSPSGAYLGGWGSPGVGPGQFCVPHAVWVSNENLVYVCDRDNSRVQIFDASGVFVGAWSGFFRPTSVFIDRQNTIFVTDLSSRLSIYAGDGSPITRIRIMADGGHSVWSDSRGDLYIVEIHQQRIDKYVRVW